MHHHLIAASGAVRTSRCAVRLAVSPRWDNTSGRGRRRQTARRARANPSVTICSNQIEKFPHVSSLCVLGVCTNHVHWSQSSLPGCSRTFHFPTDDDDKERRGRRRREKCAFSGGEEIIFPPSSARSSRLSIEMFAFDRIFRETSHFLSAVRQSTSLEARSSLKSLCTNHFSDFCRNFQRFPRLSHKTIVHSARCTSSARVLCEKCLF